MELATSLSAIPQPLLIVLAGIALLQVGLAVFALVDLYRRPGAQVVTGNKWIWVAIIVLVNFLGAILYLAVGRKPAPSADVSAAERRPPEQVEKMVDSLYGDREPEDRR